MKVAVNARLLASPSLRGWNRYTINLIAALPAWGVRPFLYTDKPLHPEHLARLPGMVVRLSPPMRYSVWEQVWLPRQCERDAVELLHCPFNFGLPWWSPCPRVLTLHDAIPQLFSRPRLRLRERLRRDELISRFQHWTARRAADEVIAVSEHAKGDLVHRLGLAPARVSVIHEAADPRFHAPLLAEDRARVRRAHALERPYVLYVGGCEERKNLPLLLEAFARARTQDVELVIGGASREQTSALRALADRLGVGARTRLLGWVRDEDLPALYGEAVVLVNPSKYEGFGLQLVEAMAVGTPVLAARATSLPEILGDGGETFSPDDPAELQRLLDQVLGEASFRHDLALRACARSSAFRWTRAAQETVHVYRRALAGGRTVSEVRSS